MSIFLFQMMIKFTKIYLIYHIFVLYIFEPLSIFLTWCTPLQVIHLLVAKGLTQAFSKVTFAIIKIFCLFMTFVILHCFVD
jgi:hypothetical protein